MAVKRGQLATLARTLGRRLKDGLAKHLGLAEPEFVRPSPRYQAVEKVARNALGELVGRAKSHPQRGIVNSANPAYGALADLVEEVKRPGLALGLRYETGEITFLDLDLDENTMETPGEAFVSHQENVALWHRLEELVFIKVDQTMVGPRKPIRPPYDH